MPRPSPMPLVQYAYEAYKYQLRWRALLAAVRGLRKSLRFGWTHRRGAAPLYAAAGLAALGGLLSTAEGGGGTAAVIAGLAACGVWQRLHGRRRGKVSRRRALTVWAVMAAASVWLIAAGAHGLRPPMPGLLLVLMLGAGVPWWWHHRIRTKPAGDPRQQMWDDYVACDGGPLAKSVLTELEPITARVLTAGITPNNGPTQTGEVIGWTGVVALPKGKTTTSRAMTKVEDVASAAELDPQAIVLEPPTPARADRVRVSVYEHNPLTQVIPWPGPHLFDAETGVVPIAVHPDAELAHYRFYRRGSGPVHDLIAGTTDAGKSRFLDMLLSIERHEERVPMVSFVIDPQEGASLPEWKDKHDGTRAVHGFARSTAEGLVLLSAIRAEMLARNRFIANYRWVDDRGRNREGLDHFDPVFWATRPDAADRLALLCLTIDEAHEPLNAGGKDDAEAIAKMARKCGIKLRLVTQVPLLDQLGNSTTLRDMVKAGNVIVMRTSTPLVGQVAFSGRLPVDPVSIPIEFPDGSTTAGMCYILGPGARPAPARMWLNGDPYQWATTGGLTPFTPLSRQLAEWMNRSVTTRAAEPDAMAEVVKEAGGPPTSGTDAIVAFLRRHGDAHTGVIADAVSMPRGTVSTLLTRLKDRGLVRQVRHGVWAAVESAAA